MAGARHDCFPLAAAEAVPFNERSGCPRAHVLTVAVQPVFAWVRARVGEHAADLTAEAFSRAWLCRRRFRDAGNGSASPWLYGIARHVLLDSLRKQRVEQAARMRLGLPVEVALDPEYEAVDSRLSLPEAALEKIATLPEPERELLLLRVVEERPYREIAARLRCSPQ